MADKWQLEEVGLDLWQVEEDASWWLLEEEPSVDNPFPYLHSGYYPEYYPE